VLRDVFSSSPFLKYVSAVGVWQGEGKKEKKKKKRRAPFATDHHRRVCRCDTLHPVHQRGSTRTCPSAGLSTGTAGREREKKKPTPTSLDRERLPSAVPTSGSAGDYQSEEKEKEKEKGERGHLRDCRVEPLPYQPL